MNKQAFDELCKYAVEKVAISGRTVLRAATHAHSSGASPARLQKFWNTFDNWGVGARRRVHDALMTGKGLTPPVKGFTTATEKQQLFDRAVDRVRGSLPPGVKPRNASLSAADVRDPSYDWRSGIITSTRDPRTLLHEVGHYKDHNLRPGVMERVRDGHYTLNLEAMANRHAARLAKLLGVDDYKTIANLNQDAYGLDALLRIRGKTRQVDAAKPVGRFRRAITTMPDIKHAPYTEQTSQRFKQLETRNNKLQESLSPLYAERRSMLSQRAPDRIAMANLNSRVQKLQTVADKAKKLRDRLWSRDYNWGYYVER